MIVLAVLLLLLAIAAVVFIVVVGTTQDVLFSFFAGNLHTRPVWIFAAGALALLLAEGGLALFRRGTRRKIAQRREIKRLRQIEQSGAAQAGVVDARAAGARADAHPRSGDPALDPDERLVRQPRTSEQQPAEAPAAPATTEQPAHPAPTHTAPPGDGEQPRGI